MSRRRLLLRLLALALFILLLIWALPRLKSLLWIVRLYREPAPTSLPVPVQGIEPSQLADTWGAARSEGRTHEGIDIFAPRGTPVIASTHGVVVRKGLNRLGGQVVGVIGPAGWYHYYAHLDAWSTVGFGDWVEVGTVLGYVGDTGNAKGTPTHLHYGIYVRGPATNPYPLLNPHPYPSPVPSPLPHRERGKRSRRRIR
ncbi:MAG TPA: M23 family metallopeptidase [Thermoanaerobaculia bacterium]|jgi:murein DD-endopeptidase MepM/ murein hydrolase activator NlpD